MSALLEVRGLTVGYGGAPVLRDVDLDVPAGSIVALVGANGAGKTTLLRTLSALVPPSARHASGSTGRTSPGVGVEDRVRRGLAHVPEGRGVVAELTVDENLRLGGLWRGPDRRAGDRRGLRAVRAARPAPEPRPVTSCPAGSGRCSPSAARSSRGPRVLLLDEPSLGLAPAVVAQIMGVLRALADRTGLTVLLAEQNVVGALSVADHGVVLGLGEVVASRPAHELAADDRLRHAYLGF